MCSEQHNQLKNSEVRRRCKHLVEIALDNVDIAGKRFEVVINLLGAEVACAQNMLDLSRYLPKALADKSCPMTRIARTPSLIPASF